MRPPGLFGKDGGLRTAHHGMVWLAVLNSVGEPPAAGCPVHGVAAHGSSLHLCWHTTQYSSILDTRGIFWLEYMMILP